MTVDASRPPFLAERLLDAALAGCPYRNDIVGDLHEAYASVLEHHSRRYARCWYCVHALGLAARYAARLRPRVKRANARDRLAIDVRYAGRSLVKRPLMTAAIVLTFALGLGANAAIFGVLNALVLQPFTLPHVDRIVMPVETGPNTSGKRDTVAPATFLDWRSEARGALEHLAAFEWWDANLVGRDQPERVLGFLVSADFFSTLGVQPVLGRGFLTEEETVGHDRRIVLSDGLWRRRFGADTAILGRPIIADGVPSIVVGIMPPGFDFPMGSELWAPLAFDPQTAASRTSDSLTVIGRLASGRRIEDAQAEMSVIADGLARKYPPSNRQRGVRVYSLARGMTDIGLRPILSFCQAVAMVVLLIACANIANLMLARGAERGREIAIRLALGSSRGRIVRDSLVESALLALLAIPLAVAMSWMGLRLMHAFLPAHIGRFVAGWNQMAVDGRVVAFTVLLGSLAALAFGSLTAIQIAPERVAETLKSDTRSGVSPGRERLRRALVVAEMALALPALVAAMLAIASVTRYLTSWQGYDPNGILTAKVVLPDSQYPDDDSRRRFATASLDALTAIPGVRGAAVANVLPSTDSNSSRRIEVAGQPVADPADRPAVDNRTVSAAYFDVLRLPVLAAGPVPARRAPENQSPVKRPAHAVGAHHGDLPGA